MWEARSHTFAARASGLDPPWLSLCRTSRFRGDPANVSDLMIYLEFSRNEIFTQARTTELSRISDKDIC